MSVTVDKCLQAWINSLRQMNAKADIVFFGDSLTYYGDFASVFPDKVVCNLGLRGDTIQGMIDRVKQVKMLEPKQVFLMAGINDVASSDMGNFENNYEDLIVRFFSFNIQQGLIVQSILPVDDKDFVISCNNEQIVCCNRIIKNLTSKYKLRYIDLFSVYEINKTMPSKFSMDGLHLKNEAYNVWFNVLKQFNK